MCLRNTTRWCPPKTKRKKEKIIIEAKKKKCYITIDQHQNPYIYYILVSYMGIFLFDGCAVIIIATATVVIDRK